MNTTERNALALKNDGIVEWTLQRFFSTQDWRCLGDRRDALQIGRLALLKAVERYEPSKGKFSPFAVLLIKRELGQALQVEDLIRLPSCNGRLKDPERRLKRKQARKIFSSSQGKGCDDPWIEAHDAHNCSGLVDKVGLEQDKDHHTLFDVREALPQALARAFAFLDPRRAEVVARVFIQGESYQQAARAMKLSKQRVQQLLEQAKRKLAKHKGLKLIWQTLFED